MEPVMTLHHFTWPVHVEERGGLIGKDFPDIYAAYVAEVVKRLGTQVRYWLTFNEPTQLIYGYIKPWWQQYYYAPPGLPGHATFTNELEAVGKLMRNLFLAHTAARKIIKEGNPDAQGGVNPMLLGLPAWLQSFIDWNVTRLRSWDDWLQKRPALQPPQGLRARRGRCRAGLTHRPTRTFRAGRFLRELPCRELGAPCSGGEPGAIGAEPRGADRRCC